jgi:tryptophan synthase alpha chain
MPDGEVIQRAMMGALSKNFGARSALKAVEALKKRIESLPVIVFGYFNPFFQMGLGGLIQTLKGARADGILVVDLPIEEGAEWYHGLIDHQIDPIYVMPHDFSLQRLKEIAPYARGFLYVTSSYAPTGGTIGNVSWLTDAISRAKSAIRLPVAVGFGIQGPKDARSIGEVADGVVVGSALIRALEAGFAQGGAERAIQEAQSFIRTLKDSLKG